MFDPWLARLVPGLSADALYHLQVLVRRSAHFAEYAILFLFLNFGPLRGRPVIAFMVCVGCASLDEALQTLRPSRSGTIFDVALDSSGAATMLVLAMPYWDVNGVCAKQPRRISAAPDGGCRRPRDAAPAHRNSLGARAKSPRCARRASARPVPAGREISKTAAGSPVCRNHP